MSEEPKKATWMIFHPDCKQQPDKAENFLDWVTLGEFQSKLSGFAHRYRLKALEADRRLEGQVVLGVGKWNHKPWVFLDQEGVVEQMWPEEWGPK